MDGILCLDKSPDMTSFHCCAILRRLLQEKKIGHGGTLDPMATGVLPLLVGKATRALDLLPVHDKRYTATLRFGYTSNTQDIWGEVIPTGCPSPSPAEVEQAVAAFRGEILQVPPMTSALKKDGVRLYDLARQGIEVEREARPVTIYRLDILEYDASRGEMRLDCHCSKGTYIRTLCADLGERLGVGAVMTSLRRTMAAGYTLEQCVTLDEARTLAESGALSARVLPTDTAFSALPAITVTAAQAVRFGNGGALAFERLPAPPTSRVRVYAPCGAFLGLGDPADAELRVCKLF